MPGHRVCSNSSQILLKFFMLVLTRKIGESIQINDDIKVTIVEIKGKNIRVGIEAPKETKIYREELFIKIKNENRSAAEPKAFDIAKVSELLKSNLKKY
tara:strand:- start:994 stop:1290 length:297 start_codon:yes stop_codon:yes gene_type:complete